MQNTQINGSHSAVIVDNQVNEKSQVDAVKSADSDSQEKEKSLTSRLKNLSDCCGSDLF